MKKGGRLIFLEEKAISRATGENKAFPLGGKEGDHIEEIF
jgi:hypothetical protein